ncbi:Metal-sulfur cluster assembly factor [uncultured Gammaproteobacteria bacterium]
MNHDDKAVIEQQVREALKQVIDPEVGINIVDLGLISQIDVGINSVTVAMTMTTPTCPLGEILTDQALEALQVSLAAGTEIEIGLTYDPPWTPERMSEAARKQLGR